MQLRRRESNPRRRSGPSESEEDADLELAGASESVPEGSHKVGESLPFIHDGQLTIFDSLSTTGTRDDAER
jgi:hypothetical protein